ncbi:hypothetical protein [Spirillospora sp. CA-294931]|uniref:hypothetical protein n=1 Tax=Spirillospora sp. CA-294931 TaxID=3240042 RepID=UPI003D94258D
MKARSIIVAAAGTGALFFGAPALAQAAPQAAPATAAQSAAPDARPTHAAKGGCSMWGCSEIQNRAKKRVWVARDWCGSASSGKPCKGTPKQKLYPGEHSYTSAYKDTDAFAVGGGCVMKVQWNADGQENGPIKTINRKGKKTKYYKVTDIQDIDIESYKC